MVIKERKEETFDPEVPVMGTSLMESMRKRHTDKLCHRGQ